MKQALTTSRSYTGQLPFRQRLMKGSHRLVNYTFVLPLALFLGAFIAYPVFLNITISFQDLRAINLLSGDAPFVGLDNYRAILANPLFLRVIGNTLVFTAGSIVFQLAIGLALALFYNLNFPGCRIMRGLYLIAWTIPIIVVGAIFRWMLQGQVGIFNWALGNLGVIDGPVFWLANPDLALGAVIFINIWLGIPFNMTLLLAGLQGIPHELYEAAEIDGASKPSKFQYITLPLLRPALLAVLLLGLIYTFRVFDLIWVTTSGGPVNATHTISTFAFRAVFQQFSFGPGAAMLNLLFLVLFAISLLYLWNLRHERTTS